MHRKAKKETLRWLLSDSAWMYLGELTATKLTQTVLKLIPRLSRTFAMLFILLSEFWREQHIYVCYCLRLHYMNKWITLFPGALFYLSRLGLPWILEYWSIHIKNRWLELERRNWCIKHRLVWYLLDVGFPSTLNSMVPHVFVWIPHWLVKWLWLYGFKVTLLFLVS